MVKKIVWVFAAAIVGLGAYVVMANPSLLIKLASRKAELQDPVVAPAENTVENPQGTWEVEYVDSDGNPLRPQSPVKSKSWFSLPFLKKQTSSQAPESNSASLAQAGNPASGKTRVDSSGRVWVQDGPFSYRRG